MPKTDIQRRATAGAVVALLALAALAATGGAAPARTEATAASATGKVVVTFRAGASAADQRRIIQAAGATAVGSLAGNSRLLDTGGRSAPVTATALDRDPKVAYAGPDYRVHAADFIPNDPGHGGAGGWQQVQWNFAGPFGVGAPAAWSIAMRDHAPGARGVTVAVIDSGVAYENYESFRRSPDLARGTFVSPHDFLSGNSHANDQEGHGTHVASTIAERTNNGIGVTGLAYNAHIMPLRVLDAQGNGSGSTVARAIVYAVVHHAQLINLSVEFDPTVRAANIPEVIGAMRYAYRRGVLIVAAAGNEARGRVSYPAAASPYALAVGASTADGCLAEYSNYGKGLALVAPGGGADAPFSDDPADAAHCHPSGQGRDVVQETFSGNHRKSRLDGFEGTSFAAPHVTAAAALLIATGRLGRHPSPTRITARLLSTAQNIGPSARYGAGLLDIPAALGP